MSTNETLFEKLVGRQPTNREMERLQRTRDALGLKDNDAIWLIMIAFGHYDTLYRQIPAQIVGAAEEVMKQTKNAADAVYDATAKRAEADLIRTVSRSVEKMTTRTASKKRWQWIAGCTAVSALMFVLVGAFSYWTGQDAGYASGQAQGYREAWNEEAALSWANTKEGQIARSLAKVVSFRDLAVWSINRLQRSGSRCTASSKRGSSYAWRIPGVPRKR